MKDETASAVGYKTKTRKEADLSYRKSGSEDRQLPIAMKPAKGAKDIFSNASKPTRGPGRSARQRPVPDNA